MEFYLVNLGCPKNAVDAEAMAMRLVAAGHRSAKSQRAADLLIVNTCGFIAAARSESLQTLRQLAAEKRPHQILIAAGCLAEREGAALARRVPGIDGYIGTRHWSQIVTLVDEIAQWGRRPRLPKAGQARTPAPLAPLSLAGHCTEGVVAPMERAAAGPTAYVKIADGCDAPCAFCAIPKIKGPQHSKPRAAILAEVRSLVDQGTREVILIAQDTTAYGRDLGEADGLAGLLPAILAHAPELTWLRVMYAYPQHIDRRLIDVLASDARIAHYLDLPLQHAHPDVLRRMRRPHDVERIARLVEELRAAIPDIALRTSFIVGFPGETEAEFEALLRFLAAMQFDRVGVFTYSREKGTPAAEMPGQVAPHVRRARYERAMAFQQGISRRRNDAQVGRTLPVLIEGTQEALSVGRSYRDAPEIDGLVLVEGTHEAGTFVPVQITGAMEYDLTARAVTEPMGRQ